MDVDDILALTDEELQRLEASDRRLVRRLERRFERTEAIAGCSRASDSVKMQAARDAMNDVADKRTAD